MGFEVAVGTIPIGTGAISTLYTVTGKTPASGTWKAVILFWSGRPETTDAAGETDILPGIGVAVSATSRWATVIMSDHAVATSATGRYMTNAACVALIDVLGAATALADFDSFTADGFRLIIDDVFPAALEVSYILLGGTDLTDAVTGVFTLPGATGTYNAVTSLSFQPSFLLTASSLRQNDPPFGSGAGTFTLGAATSAAQAMLASSSRNAVASSLTHSYCKSGEIQASPDIATLTTTERISFVDFSPSTGFGFRYNSLEGTSTVRNMYLALKGGSYAIGNFLSATNTTAFTEAHGMSVTPKGAMFFSANRVESTTDVTTNPMEWSVGASDGTNNTCQYARDKNAVSPTDSFTAVSHDQCYYNADNSTTQVIEGEGHVNSFDSTNINFQMTDADAAQSFIWYVAFGDAPGVTANAPKAKQYYQAVQRAAYF